MGFEMFIVLGVVLVAMIVFSLISRKRNKKEINSYEEMLNSLEKGDKVYLISRLVAYVVCVESLPNGDKLITVETGLDDRKSSLTFDIKAVHSVLAKANAGSTVKKEEIVEEVAQEVTQEVAQEVQPTEQAEEVK